MFNICPVDLIQSNAVIKSADLFFTRSPEHHFQYPNIGNTLFGWKIIVFTKQQFYLQWLTDLKAFDILSLSIGIEIIYMYVCVCVCVLNVSGEKETMPYFAAHFEQQLHLYKTQVSVFE